MKEGHTLLDDITKEITRRQCEAIIKEGLEAMSKVDRALSIIHDMKLYSDTHSSFETYCQIKWNLDDKYNHLDIKGAKHRLTLPLPQNNITRRKYESRK